MVLSSSQLGGTAGADNLQFVQNAVDWALADTDLLSIRAHSSSARALTVPEGSRTKWEVINYVIALLGLVAVVLISWLRRRSVRPFDLPKEVVS